MGICYRPHAEAQGFQLSVKHICRGGVVDTSDHYPKAFFLGHLVGMETCSIIF
jgi:hypothetical protein